MMNFRDIQKGDNVKVWIKQRSQKVVCKSATVIFANRYYFTVKFQNWCESFIKDDIRCQSIRVEADYI